MIPKWAFALGFGGFILFIIGVQLILAPPEIFRFSADESLSASNSSEKAFLRSQFPSTTFQNAGLGDIVLSQQSETNQFFYTTLFPSEELGIRVLKSLYAKKEGTETIPLIAVYEFFPTKDTTVTNAYGKLKNFFLSSLNESIEAELNETNTYGEFSFFINLGKEQKTVYLIVAHKNELIGFEYPRAQHEAVKKVIETYFGPPPASS